ncbi:hypothetical protein MHOCP_11740 [Moorella humiferrea]|uniref:DUF1540 domain-containing protein n=2 Tax=Neomoorella humiferrea TaxID=676965 RepID=A0A2T0AXI4_9FIRM|nr:DUF1540 domain-containing protein [Moorella humiferrea]PRR75514.1 hypothetical protein MOHU_02780 [Moorella humiferrea]
MSREELKIMDGPKVKCKVNTCNHWMNGDLCSAGNIDITHEEEGKMAQNPEQTQCKTFYVRRGLANMLGSLDNVNWGGLLSNTFLPGGELYPSVTCIVNTCAYWTEGNRCQAKKIDVVGVNADESQDTNCFTFKRKV